MMIEIHISSVLHDIIPDLGKNLGKDKWEIDEGTEIQKVLDMLNIGEIPIILMLNGRQGDRTNPLSDGDCLKIFGVLAGG